VKETVMSTQTISRARVAASEGELYVSFELGDKKWKLTASDGHRAPSRYNVDAGDTATVAYCIAKARNRCKLGPQARVHCCYEAGRDGWWLHRWLREQGADNIVVDACSIEVNRRARRAKTDRLDGDKLLSMLLRHHSGERVWSVLHEPTPEDEDARRLHRELVRLMQERTSHTNRIGSLLVLHNLRPLVIIGGRDWPRWWERHCEQVPAVLRAEIEREFARLMLVKQQVKAIEAKRCEALQDGSEPMVSHLVQLKAIGYKGAWVLVKELFGWRRFNNRRELAGSLGLAPTPYASGDSQHEQGISKAGNKRARTLLVEVAWGWLRWQPASALTEWFNRRFSGGGKRMRRVGIVALARRLAIALWRYLQSGEIPAGATLKPAA
jgi:transposase